MCFFYSENGIMQNRPRPVPNSNIQFGCDIRTNLWKSNESKRLNDENNFFCLKLNMVKNLRLKIVLARKRPVCCTLYSKKHTCIIVVSVCILQSIMYFSCVTATNSHCTQRCFHLISHVVFSFSSFFSLFFCFLSSSLFRYNLIFFVRFIDDFSTESHQVYFDHREKKAHHAYN